jgi:predicted Zn-ribbon and HTH transcriptional regulator
VTRVDDRGTHYADCIFCGLEWIVSSMVKDPYTCPRCRALYKQKPTKKARKKK